MRAAATAFRSERYLQIDSQSQREPFGAIGGFYQAGDGNWLQIHAGFPHHRDIALQVLGCTAERRAVETALAPWSARDVEQAVTEAGGCAAAVRSAEEWAAQPHADAVASQKLVSFEQVGDAARECRPLGPRPLSGIRVLDLTRVIAGPVCGRTLAEHGADVLRIASPNLPSRPDLVIDTGHGKRSAWVDLDTEDGRSRLWALIREADVLVQSYRPGALAARGFGPEQVAAARPGIVYVSLSAYGVDGPWAGKRGFDSLVQCVTGIADEEAIAGGADAPRHLPCQALDHATGYLSAFAAIVGLLRRAERGGSWHMRLSLARTAAWLSSLGRVDGLGIADPTLDDVRDLMQITESPVGSLHHVRPAAVLTETPPFWDRAPAPLGGDAPVWLDRA